MVFRGGRTTGSKNLVRDKTAFQPLAARSLEVLALDLEDPDKRGSAARYILDQYYGRAPTPVEVAPESFGPLVAVIRELAKDDGSKS